MNILTRLFGSSLGKKYLMAFSGAALFLFVCGHMAGNLQLFLGREQLNAYGHFLQSTKELLWPVRLGLLTLIGLHVWAAVKLTLENRAARPVPYAVQDPVAASLASRTLIYTGLIIATFVVFHLLHYTVKVPALNFTGQDFATLRDEQGRTDIYRMVILGFSNGWVTAFYLLSVGLLCFHLGHGVGSMFQSLGLKNRAYEACINRAAKVLSVLLFLGYASVPIAVFLGYGKELTR